MNNTISKGVADIYRNTGPPVKLRVALKNG